MLIKKDIRVTNKHCILIPFCINFFISEDDEEYVKDDILEYLEGRGYKVCWRERDFEPGGNQMADIQEATEHSRRLLFVISR